LFVILHIIFETFRFRILSFLITCIFIKNHAKFYPFTFEFAKLNLYYREFNSNLFTLFGWGQSESAR
jgi:hypothetical protein